ncbi:hypothetical protein GOODEAATRI_004339 [Goodea atripinnis]|uniref:DNA helicase n=1 Tax=Goodea atripinnis TaxID=208336 RepID=A0ABV0MYJ9_9TELE
MNGQLWHQHFDRLGTKMVEYLHEAKASRPYPYVLTLENDDQHASQAFVIIVGQAFSDVFILRIWQENISPRDLQNKGVCLLKLQIGSQSTGLYGRTVIVLEPRKHLGFSSLPSNSFGPGDIVGLYDTAGCSALSQICTGIVTRISQASVSVAFDDLKDGASLDSDGACDDGPLKFLPEEHFDWVVIDECAQALESSCWIALLRARKCILAGDYKQLPPTIKSQRDLPSVACIEETSTPLLLIDTAGCGLSEMEIADEQSKGNQGEVGFLAEDRRINVAVTRARRHIAVVCDTQTVRNHAFLKSLVDHMTEFGVVRTAFEYLQDIVPQNYTRDPKDTKTATSSTSRKQKSRDQASIKAKQGQKTTSSTKDKTAGPQNHTKSHTSAQKDQNEGKSRYAEIRTQVENFMKDESMKHFHFPSSFNSHDRLLVHQIAEELGLVHESRGEGGDRCITVSRPVKSEPAEEPAQEKTQEEETAPALQRKSKTKAGACDIAAAAAPDDDFDALISAVVKADSVCSFVKCKTSVLTLGQLCLFCNRQYCLSHHIPEVRISLCAF